LVKEMSAISLSVLEEAVARWRRAHPAFPCKIRYPEREGTNQSYEDYTIVFEACFLSPALDQAQFEIWLTDDNCVAIGIETWDRLAQRLRIHTWTHGFLFGHEPSRVTMNVVEAVYAIASGGDLTVDCGRVLKVLTSVRCPALEVLGLPSRSGWALSRDTVVYRAW
jgi:hypothetical protein